MREGIPVIFGPGTDPVIAVLESQAEKTGAPAIRAAEVVDIESYPGEPWTLAGTALWREGALHRTAEAVESEGFRWRLPLTGGYMLNNLTTALAVVDAMRAAGITIPEDAIIEGVRSVRWPGRLQHVQAPGGWPDLVLDVGHNAMAATAIGEELASRTGERPVRLVIALAEDKELEGFLEPLIGHAEAVVATQWEGPRARPPEHIAAAVKSIATRRGIRVDTEIATDPAAAVTEASRDLDQKGLVVVVGSHNLVGPILELLGQDGGEEKLWPGSELSGT
jgi:dihydrofolate synthase/folylpolyglutamate synthase